MKLDNLILCGLVLFCGLTALGTTAFAEPDHFICAAAEAIACPQDEACIRGSANRTALPTLWKLDLKEKTIKGFSENREIRSSEIHRMIKAENTLILQGIDKGRAWSMGIDLSDEKMTLSASAYDAGYIVHGTCNSRILK